MALDAATASLVDSESNAASRWWRKCRDFLLRYRIRISLFVFATLIAEDYLDGVKPHNLLQLAEWHSMVGLGLIVAGLGLRSWAAGILHKSTELTTVGPYSLVRHPLYVGSFMMMIGICLLIDDPENIWFVLGPIGFIYLLKLLQEERLLEKKFGALWHEYASRVPRLVPYHLPQQLFAPWSLNQWLLNREYNALAATALGLAAIQAWSMS